MTPDLINKEFAAMINRRGIYKVLGVSQGLVGTLRYNLANNIPISTDQKVKLLKKSGWQYDGKDYTREDMIEFAKFALRAGAAAKEEGAAYLFEKWLVKQKNIKPATGNR